MKFDPEKAMLKDKSFFKPFNVKQFQDADELIQKGKINANEEILVFEVDGDYYGLKHIQMIYHHIAQGTIKNEPFMVSF